MISGGRWICLVLATVRRQTTAAFRAPEAAANITFLPLEDPSEADILIGAQDQLACRAFMILSWASTISRVRSSAISRMLSGSPRAASLSGWFWLTWRR